MPAPFPADYQVTLSQAARTWLTLGATDGLSAVYTVSDYPAEQARVAALQIWLAGNILDVDVTSIRQEAAIGQAPASFSVKSAAPWMNLGRVPLPIGGDVAANAGLTLLQLPPELGALASQTVTVTLPDGARKVIALDAPPVCDLTPSATRRRAARRCSCRSAPTAGPACHPERPPRDGRPSGRRYLRADRSRGGRLHGTGAAAGGDRRQRRHPGRPGGTLPQRRQGRRPAWSATTSPTSAPA